MIVSYLDLFLISLPLFNLIYLPPPPGFEPMRDFVWDFSMLEPLLELFDDLANVLFVDSIYPWFYLGLVIPEVFIFLFSLSC
jgi:hypothetical protein